MKFVLLLCATSLVILVPASAQQSSAPQPSASQSLGAASQDLSARVPPAKPEDVKSIDAILRAIYDVISGPAGDRDWNRFRSLFVPEARFTSTTKSNTASGVRLFDVEGFIHGAGDYFKTHPFYESAIVNRVQKFGDIAQVFSSYESRNAPAERPFTRGINSIQLFYDGSRWWVLSILWDEETPNNPLPHQMANKTSHPAT